MCDVRVVGWKSTAYGVRCELEFGKDRWFPRPSDVLWFITDGGSLVMVER
jgi:hypothetical protein